MQLDYKEMIKLVRIRKAQIKDASFEVEKFNTEFVKLGEVEILLADLIVNDRVEIKRVENETEI